MSVNGNNQITNTGFSYDSAGNMTADGINSYGYDAEERVAWLTMKRAAMPSTMINPNSNRFILKISPVSIN